MAYRAEIVEAEFDRKGTASGWKIVGYHPVSGGQASKKDRQRCRDRANKLFGSWFFRKNPPTQQQVDEAFCQ